MFQNRFQSDYRDIWKPSRQEVSPKRDSDKSSSRLLNPFIFLTLSSFLDFIPILGYLGQVRKSANSRFTASASRAWSGPASLFPPGFPTSQRLSTKAPWQKALQSLGGQHGPEWPQRPKSNGHTIARAAMAREDSLSTGTQAAQNSASKAWACRQAIQQNF